MIPTPNSCWHRCPCCPFPGPPLIPRWSDSFLDKRIRRDPGDRQGFSASVPRRRGFVDSEVMIANYRLLGWYWASGSTSHSDSDTRYSWSQLLLFHCLFHCETHLTCSIDQCVRGERVSVHEIIGTLGWGPRHAGWMDRQTDRWIDHWIEGRVDQWMGGWIVGRYERRGEGNE